jgi:hypothetical protein
VISNPYRLNKKRQFELSRCTQHTRP